MEIAQQLDPLAWYKERVQDKGRVEGQLLFSKIWGSWSHGTQLPTSDVDYLAVYVATNEALLGLDKPSETVTGEKPDYQVHEVGKFCDLLLKGNPGIIEMLFTDRLYWGHPKWEVLGQKRKAFLSQKVVKQYLGYAQAQIKRLEAGQSVHSKGGAVGEKWAYHMYRLVLDAKRIAEGGEPKVWKDGDELVQLMDIRRGAISPMTVVQMTTEKIAAIDAMKTWKIDLPEEGDKRLLQDWLLWVRGIGTFQP